MGIVRADQILKMADRANTSVIAFICLDYNMVRSVFSAAEAKRKPAIIMLLPEHVTVNKVAEIKEFAAMVKKMGESVSVPVALHLDHSYDEKEIYDAIDAGFTSVMFDASREDFQTNILRTKKIVEYAHSKGVVVEAELGAVGLAKNKDNERKDFFTRPDAVERFCRETGVDSLAISIGNAHGDYPFPPKLDLERLDEINNVTDVPLVLHGGSGIPDDQLVEAFSRGINKFNYGTDVLRCYDQAIREYHEKHQPADSLDFLGIPEHVQKAMTAFIAKKMELCLIKV
ncbi:MAG: class II fructose-bisphosphate aldolase [Candidatus Choladocola sp.]|nr:class II fructose-bisphosphate aldolase [Candidatus Choladocola sp.]